ncbi:hypothetical protein KY332_03445 [Candidatus Woesearchaeota archaeon]|nr:hypothetical protein [Candidatus Woesearchaeota archaeon]
MPGFFITYSLKLKFLERIIIGGPISAAIVGILAYYLGLMGVDLLYSFILLPLIIVGIVVIMNLKK